jgi:hypothetical protein
MTGDIPLRWGPGGDALPDLAGRGGSRGSLDAEQALSALLFLYREVLDVDLPWLDEVVRAKRPERLPVVLTRDEVRELSRSQIVKPLASEVLL